MGPNPVTPVPIRRGKFGPRCRSTGRGPCEGGGGDQSHVSPAERTRVVSYHQKLSRGEERSCSRGLRESTALPSLDFRLPASRTAGEHMSVVSSHQVCGNFCSFRKLIYMPTYHLNSSLFHQQDALNTWGSAGLALWEGPFPSCGWMMMAFLMSVIFALGHAGSAAPLFMKVKKRLF